MMKIKGKEVEMKENMEVVKSKEQNIERIDPQGMIKLAIEKNADLDKLEKLLDIQIKWEQNEAKKAYVIAMAKFKENPPKIDKDKHVKFNTSKGVTEYKHASLANVTEKINSDLSKHGLSASWITKQNGSVCVTCKITHDKGHSEETSLSAPADVSGSKNPIQAIASTISYLQRYTLLSLCGLATREMDDDAQTAVPKVYITGEQLSRIRDYIDNFKQFDEVRFCKVIGCESINKIECKDFDKAINLLETKKKQEK